MGRDEQGFTVDVENEVHLMKIRLWGRWDTDTGAQYLREVQQQLSRISGNHDADWSLLLDLSGYVLPSHEVQTYIEQGFIHLSGLTVIRQAVLLHGPIIHLPGQTASQAETCVTSYFQSEDEALEWLLNE